MQLHFPQRKKGPVRTPREHEQSYLRQQAERASFCVWYLVDSQPPRKSLLEPEGFLLTVKWQSRANVFFVQCSISVDGELLKAPKPQALRHAKKTVRSWQMWQVNFRAAVYTWSLPFQSPLWEMLAETAISKHGPFMMAYVGLSHANCSSRLSFSPVCFLLLTATPSHSCFLSQCRFNKPISKPSRPGAFKDLRLLNVKHLIISDYFQ